MPLEKIDVLLHKADEHFLRGEYSKAEALAREVISRGCEAKDKARALCIIGECYRTVSRNNEALPLFQEALALAENIPNIPLQIAALYGIVNLYERSGNYDAAMDEAQRGLTLAERGGDKQGEARMLYTLGGICYTTGDYLRALEYQTRALPLVEGSGMKRQIGNVLRGIANAYQGFGDYSRALEYYSRSLSFAEEIGAKFDIGKILGAIGILHWDLGDYPRALDFMARSLSIAEDLGDKIAIATNVGNMGIVSSTSGNYPDALKYLERALELSGKIGAKRPIGFWMQGIAHVQRKMGMLDAAYQGYMDTLQYRREVLKANEAVTTVLLNLGGILVEQGKIEEGMTRFQEALQMAEEAAEKKNTAQAYKEISDVYVIQGDHAKALDHFRKFYTIDKETFNDESRKKFEAFNIRFAIAEKEKEKEIEKMRKEELERELSNTTLQLIAQTELLSDLRTSLSTIVRKLPSGDDVAKELREKLRNLPCKSVDWERFDMQFKAAHPEFTQHLTSLYPMLSTTEIRICSLVRMNLKSEEIAQLFCLSARTVENHRYRIRSKMQLVEGTDLAKELMKL